MSDGDIRIPVIDTGTADPKVVKAMKGISRALHGTNIYQGASALLSVLLNVHGRLDPQQQASLCEMIRGALRVMEMTPAEVAAALKGES